MGFDCGTISVVRKRLRGKILKNTNLKDLLKRIKNYLSIIKI